MPPSRQPAAPTESLSGSVKSVVFHNEETGWFVATVAVDGGAPGGFPEKATAARATGAQLVVLRRPAETGHSFEQVLKRCLAALDA